MCSTPTVNRGPRPADELHEIWVPLLTAEREDVFCRRVFWCDQRVCRQPARDLIWGMENMWRE